MLIAGDARQAERRSRKAERVGSSPTAGSWRMMTPGPDGQAVGCNPTTKQVRLLPASLNDSCGVTAGSHTKLLTSHGMAYAGSIPAAGACFCVRGRAAEAPTCRVGYVGATPAGHSECDALRPVTQRVWRPACRAGETGSSPVQGADHRAVAERPGNRLIRGTR